MAGEYRWHVLSETIRFRSLSLKAKLGAKCQRCGDDDPLRLQFHHKNGKCWRSNSLGPLARIKRYEEEAAQGLIQLLCDFCHNNPEQHPDTCFCPACREQVDF